MLKIWCNENFLNLHVYLKNYIHFSEKESYFVDLYFANINFMVCSEAKYSLREIEKEWKRFFVPHRKITTKACVVGSLDFLCVWYCGLAILEKKFYETLIINSNIILVENYGFVNPKNLNKDSKSFKTIQRDAKIAVLHF